MQVCKAISKQSQQFAENEALELVPSHADGVESKKIVTTSCCLSMCVPHLPVPCIMGQDLIPQEALMTLIPIVCNLELELQCRRKKKERAYFASSFHPCAARANSSRCARSVRAPPLALRKHHPLLCARCRFALRKVQVCSARSTRLLWARCRVALREVQGRPGRGEGLRCARVRVALGEVQGRFWRGAGSLCASRHL